jgi:hypothetical protein
LLNTLRAAEKSAAFSFIAPENFNLPPLANFGGPFVYARVIFETRTPTGGE